MPAIKAVPAPAENDDDVLKSIQLLRDDTKSAYDSFTKKIAAGTLDLAGLAAELKEMVSLQADLAGLLFQATFENLEWAAEVDEDIDALKEGLSATTILPEDAMRLKSTILSLVQNLREPTDPHDEALAALKARAAEAVAFIDEATEADDDDDETDEEVETETN
jgi:hypothetical protein